MLSGCTSDKWSALKIQASNKHPVCQLLWLIEMAAIEDRFVFCTYWDVQHYWKLRKEIKEVDTAYVKKCG